MVPWVVVAVALMVTLAGAVKAALLAGEVIDSAGAVTSVTLTTTDATLTATELRELGHARWGIENLGFKAINAQVGSKLGYIQKARGYDCTLVNGEVFMRDGFHAASMKDICAAAGMSPGSVYRYFRSKDDLLVSIFDRTMKQRLAEGRAAVADIAEPAERLRQFAHLHLGMLGRDRNLAIVFQVELRQSVKFMERFSSTLLRDYLGQIRAAIADERKGAARRALDAAIDYAIQRTH